MSAGASAIWALNPLSKMVGQNVFSLWLERTIKMTLGIVGNIRGTLKRDCLLLSFGPQGNGLFWWGLYLQMDRKSTVDVLLFLGAYVVSAIAQYPENKLLVYERPIKFAVGLIFFGWDTLVNQANNPDAVPSINNLNL